MSAAILSPEIVSFALQAGKKILEFYREKYGPKKEDLEKGEAVTFDLLSEYQAKAIVVEEAYSSWLKGDSRGAIRTIRNSGLFDDVPRGNPNIIEWFSKHTVDLRKRIIGSVRALRALEKEIGYELCSFEVELSLMPNVTVTFQRSSQPQVNLDR
jgi:hypothetical protein